MSLFGLSFFTFYCAALLEPSPRSFRSLGYRWEYNFLLVDRGPADPASHPLDVGNVLLHSGVRLQ